MTQLPPDDKELKAFLHQHRPTPPPPNPELEAQLMIAITNNPHAQKPIRRQRLLAIASSLAASLLLVWSSSPFLITKPDNASLEAFLESNWNDVTGQIATNTPSNIQSDWMLEASTPY